MGSNLLKTQILLVKSLNISSNTNTTDLPNTGVSEGRNDLPTRITSKGKDNGSANKTSNGTGFIIKRYKDVGKSLLKKDDLIRLYIIEKEEDYELLERRYHQGRHVNLSKELGESFHNTTPLLNKTEDIKDSMVYGSYVFSYELRVGWLTGELM
jgi:hypothetical protein